MPLILAMLIGIGGSLFTLNVFKKNQEPQILGANEGNAKVSIGLADSSPVEQQTQSGAGLKLLQSVEKTIGKLNSLAYDQKLDLPDLLDSDDVFRKHVVKLSPGLAQWLSSDQLIRRYMVIANDFAQGFRVAKHMSLFRFEQPFSVLENGNALYFAPKCFHRYDALAQAIQAINAKEAVEVYLTFRPLMLQVFEEFKYPKGITLENMINKAAGEILATPFIEGQIELVRPSLFYKYADPKLEALSPVQKQMIRMGPDNMRIIQNKCREFLVALAKK